MRMYRLRYIYAHAEHTKDTTKTNIQMKKYNYFNRNKKKRKGDLLLTGNN